MKMKFLSAAVLLGGLALSPAAAPAMAAPVPGPTPQSAKAAGDCGFHYERNWDGVYDAYYRHCTNEPYSVQVDVVYNGGLPKETFCMKPNQNKFLGDRRVVKNAYYNGRLC